MKKFLILVIGLVLIGILQGTTIIVDIEGTGDYISIQEGINSSTDGDTVLVYPGRYYENIDFIGKEIALASLELTIGNRMYIHSTIIDGNQTGSCVAVHSGEGEGSIIRGFTLTNGIGYMYQGYRGGGGIFLNEATLDIVNCIIENNQAFSGGGINILEAWAYLEGVTIRNNSASRSGGGIYSGCLPASITYSYENRCNIYDNFSIWGLDFCNRLEYGTVTDVVVDTFTVFDPWSYEFYQGESGGEQIYDESVFDMQHAKYERVYCDLYVSTEGDNENSGLTPDEPLQTLNQALHYITASAEHPLTIHLAEGIYSTELNDQKFPINLRSYVSIIGESEENTIIELNGIDQGFALDLFSDLGYSVKNLTIRNGFAVETLHIYNRIFHIINYAPHSISPVLLENIYITGNAYNQLLRISRLNLTLRNVTFDDNFGNQNSVSLHNLMSYCNFDCTVLMENCRIINNQSGFLHLDAAMNNQNDHTVNIVNCEFVNNNYFNSFTDYTVGISFFAHDDQRLNIVNSTFSSNIFEGIYVGNAPLRLTNGIEVEILNTIIYNNETEYSIILDTENTNLIPVLDVHHSIIEDGLEGVLSDDYCILNWDEDTISEADPSFMYDGEYPYKLQEGSPAIDAGSLDLPEGIVLPEYDLAGNLRVRGNGIDIGAYEYNPYSSPVNENELEYSNLVIYPNPVHLKQGRGSVIINYPTSDDEADYELSIYNIKGQRVKSFKIQNSKFKIGEASWDLRDDEGDEVVAGVYFVRVAKDGVFIDQGKVTVVK